MMKSSHVCMIHYHLQVIYRYTCSYFQIELDFENIYPGKDKILSLKWDKYTSKIFNIFKESVKDQHCKDFLKLIVGDTPTETIDFVSIYLLPAILQPTIIHSVNKKWKPSILESQQTLILHVEVMQFKYICSYLLQSYFFIFFYRLRMMFKLKPNNTGNY